MGLKLCTIALVLSAGSLAAQTPPTGFTRPLRTIDSIPAPESVAVGPDGAWYVSSFGKFDVKGDGAIFRIDPDKGTREVFAGGLDDPCGVIFAGGTLWVADRTGVYRVTRGKVERVFAEKQFPRPLHFLNDLATDASGKLYVSDTGDSTAGGHGAIFLLRAGKRPTVLIGSDTATGAASANGLFRGGGDTLYVVGYHSGTLSITDGHGSWKTLATGLGSPDGIESAAANAFYISDNVGGDLFRVPRAGGSPAKLASGLQAPADLVVDRERGLLLVPENAGNRLSVYRLASGR
jgi:sugar lactone lactonase YvrE